MSIPGFELRFDGNPSHGDAYWYAATSDGGYDASGATPMDALANLVTELHKTILELNYDLRSLRDNLIVEGSGVAIEPKDFRK